MTTVEMEHDVLTTRALRDAFAQFPSGVVGIAAEIDGVPVGMAASTFVPVSLDPPLCGVFIANTSTTWPRLRAVRTIGISVLGSAHSLAARKLAGPTAPRFEGLATVHGEGDALFIDDAPLHLEVEIENELPAGDHLLALLRIRSVTVSGEHAPLLFHRSKLAGFVHAVDAR